MLSDSLITSKEKGESGISPTAVKKELVLQYSDISKEAEMANGRLAMIGFIALIGAYSISGQVIPGIF